MKKIGKEARERLLNILMQELRALLIKIPSVKELRTINKRIMKSDDEHVIALAKAANVKIIVYP